MTLVPARRIITADDKALAELCARGRIIVVDDDTDFRTALAALFDLEGYACETYASANECLHALETAIPSFPGPCCLICDVQMPGIDGLQLQQHLAGHDEMPHILMSGASGIHEAVSAFRAGAQDFLIKPFDDEVLLAAVSKALLLSSKRQELRHRKLSVDERIASLNERETQVVYGVTLGQTNGEIAETLAMSLRTVKRYRHSAMEKLGVTTTAELAAFMSGASRLG